MPVPYTFADTTLSGLNLNLAHLDADFAYFSGSPQLNSLGVGMPADGVTGDIVASHNITASNNISASGTVSDGSGTLRPFIRMPSINGAGLTTVLFSGIPSWAQRITINFYGVVVSGGSTIRIQVGNASGFLTNSYYSTITDGTLNSNTTVGFNVTTLGGGSNFNYGTFTLNAAYPAPYVSGVTFWVQNSIITNSNDIKNITLGGGGIAVGGDLTQIKIYTVNGTDTFSGIFGLTYE